MMILKITPNLAVQTMKFLLMVYAMNTSHTLNSLIMIEFMSITLTSTAFMIINHLKMEMYLVMFIMILMVVESILGLSLLINLIRTHSNDYMKSAMTASW